MSPRPRDPKDEPSRFSVRADMKAKRAGSRKEGKERITRSVMLTYRNYYVIEGEDIPTVANRIADDFKLDNETERKGVQNRLRAFAAAENWKWFRQQYVHRVSMVIEDRLIAETADSYLSRTQVVGDTLLEQGLQHATMMVPGSMREALDMVKLGHEIGLRGRNLPTRVRAPASITVNSTTNQTLVTSIQNLPPGDYATLANALDAEFAALADGLPAATGDDEGATRRRPLPPPAG